MKSKFEKLGSSDQSGVALIIVLAFVVLLTGLIVAFFSRTLMNRQVANSSANEAKADLMAKGGLDVIVGDLKQEIADGSTVTKVGDYSVYRPNSAADMRPRRSGNPTGTPDPDPNLIRRSVRSDSIVSPGVKSRASTINSSTDLSSNGRSISLARWNSHYLLPRFTKLDVIDSTPDNFIAPDWVLVTRGGPSVQTAIGSGPGALNNPEPSNNNYVMGRYAYAIYDEGRLLDMNVAGSPSSLTVTQIGEKGALALADLTQLPVVKTPAGASDYMTQTQIDQLVGWRNGYTGQPSGSFGNFTFGADAATNWLNKFVRANDSGFMKVAGSISGLTDQAFLSRQELIKLSRVLGVSQNALQYMGTFSRQLNAPSWEPRTDAGSMVGSANGKNDGVNVATGAKVTDAYAYKANADLPSSINRRFPNVRVTKPFTRLDGRPALTGEPLVQNRFDLGKLAWIRADGVLPNGVTNADIYNYFGLTRNADASWTYSHQTSGTATKIMTLEEVANEGRDPDFFELLQAAVLQGSLGLVSGDPSKASSSNEGGEFYRRELAKNLGASLALSWYAPLLRTDANGDVVYAQEKYQIIQIGANLIDQADADSIPTEIVLNNEHFYGVENLPYISGIGQTVLRPAPGGAITPNDYQAYVHQWMTVALWNPHQNAVSSLTSGPSSIRVLVDGGEVQPTVHGTPVVATSADEGRDYSTTNSWLEFNLGSYPGAFSEPTAIDYDSSTTSDPKGRIKTSQGWKRAGIYMGYSYSPESVKKVAACAPVAADAPKSPYETQYRAANVVFSQPLTVKLQYKDANGGWHTYEELRGLVFTRDGRGDPYMEPSDPAWATSIVDTNKGPLTADQEAWVVAPLDPRAPRFNLPNLKNNKLGESYVNNNVGVAPPVGPNFVQATLWKDWVNNSLTSSAYYTDRDSVRRVGNAAGWANADPQKVGGTSLRSLVLNRPFRNVGELGHVFRDDPWKNLNFITTNSADAALLDVFSVGPDPATVKPAAAVVAGKVNINNASAPVLQALVMGTARSYKSTDFTQANTTVTAADSKTIGTDIVTKVQATSFFNVSELPGIFPQDTTTNTKYPGSKEQREAALRALADSADTRTWNLLIDIIAQSGRYGGSATKLSEFMVEGEKRYWLHVAIDRVTGQVVDQQLEPVSE